MLPALSSATPAPETGFLVSVSVTMTRYPPTTASPWVSVVAAKCGAVLKNALGHDYKGEVTAPTCEKMGYTTFTCSRCGDPSASV